jgi:ligand-binding SRPBCC domain-containing protein
MYVIERAQVIPAPLEEAFRFFEDPRNLAEITPAWLRFEIVGLDGLPLRAGCKIEYRIRWLGIPFRWLTVITDYEPGRRFVDLQTRGPYRLWRHEHTFEDLNGQTMMRDRVEYELPLGLIGRIVHRLLVSHHLRQIFDFRSARIGEIFGPKHPEGKGLRGRSSQG